MNKISFKERINNPRLTVAAFLRKVWWLFPNDRQYLKMMYYLQMGHKLNLKTPKKFSEKIQWLKLYYRKPELTKMVDKYAVKEYVAKIIGDEHIVPTLGVWNSPDEIEWDFLPDKFVLKVTHGGGGGGIIICKDKKRLNKARAINMLKKAMKVNIYGKYREWPYKNVPRRIIAEQLLEEKNEHGLMDYKVFCCNGIPKMVKVNYDVATDYHVNWYDLNWNKIEGTTIYDPTDATVEIQKPAELDELLALSQKLSHGIPYLRVDFYICNHVLKFGELTLFPGSGFEKFTPESFDATIGEWIELPELCVGGG